MSDDTTLTLEEREALNAMLGTGIVLQAFRKVLRAEEQEADDRLKTEAMSMSPDALVMRGHAATSLAYNMMEQRIRARMARA